MIDFQNNEEGRLPSGGNGRKPNGQFAPGNRLAKGNPLARRVQKLRAALVKAVTPDDVAAIVKTLIVQAKAGDVAAAKLVLERVLGRPDAKIELTDDRHSPKKVEVVFDGDWYGNAGRLAELAAKRVAGPSVDSEGPVE